MKVIKYGVHVISPRLSQRYCSIPHKSSSPSHPHNVNWRHPNQPTFKPQPSTSLFFADPSFSMKIKLKEKEKRNFSIKKFSLSSYRRAHFPATGATTERKMPQEKVLSFDKKSQKVKECKPARDDENVSSAEMKRSKKKILMEFRARVEDSILNSYLLRKNPGKCDIKEDIRDISLWGVPLLPSKGHPGTDIVLMKFLKAKDFKVSDAFNMLRKTLRWRKENKVDGILEENLGSDLENVGYVDGTDKAGHPLCYNMYGVYKDKELYKKRFGSKEKCVEFLRWRIQFMEKCIQKLEFTPGGADSFVQIINLKNMPGPAMKEIRWISRKAILVLRDYYPGIISKNIIINVPLWFLAFHALHLRMIIQKAKSKFIFARPARVTKTLLKYIAPENIPVQYGGLKRDNDDEFSPDDKVLERNLKGSTHEDIQIPIGEAGMTIRWDLAMDGYELSYKEEFVPDDDCSYKVLLQKGKKMGKSVTNSFHITEPGKIVITIENGTHENRVFYRYKIKPTVPMYIFLK